MRVLASLAVAGFAGLYTYALFASRRFESLTPESAGAPGNFVTINGVSVHYVEVGRGPPVVLLHGWNGSTFSYRYAIPELAAHHRVVAVDLIGFGYSERPGRGDYTITAQVELIRGLMDYFGIETAAVAGHSMGGAIAMSFAFHYPARISRLVLIDSVSPGEARRATTWLRFVAPLLPLVAIPMQFPSMRRRVAGVNVHDPALVTPEFVEGYFRPLRMKGHLRGLMQQAAQRRSEQPMDPAQLRLPVLVLWGEHDRVIPLSTGEKLAGQIPGARLEVIGSAGHLPLEEQPALCNRLLAEFLDPRNEPEGRSAAPFKGVGTFS